MNSIMDEAIEVVNGLLLEESVNAFESALVKGRQFVGLVDVIERHTLPLLRNATARDQKQKTLIRRLETENKELREEVAVLRAQVALSQHISAEARRVNAENSRKLEEQSSSLSDYERQQNRWNLDRQTSEEERSKLREDHDLSKRELTNVVKLCQELKLENKHIQARFEAEIKKQEDEHEEKMREFLQSSTETVKQLHHDLIVMTDNRDEFARLYKEEAKKRLNNDQEAVKVAQTLLSQATTKLRTVYVRLRHEQKQSDQMPQEVPMSQFAQDLLNGPLQDFVSSSSHDENVVPEIHTAGGVARRYNVEPQFGGARTSRQGDPR